MFVLSLEELAFGMLLAHVHLAFPYYTKIMIFNGLHKHLRYFISSFFDIFCLNSWIRNRIRILIFRATDRYPPPVGFVSFGGRIRR